MQVRIVTRNNVNIVRIDGAVKTGDEFILAEKIEKYIKPNQAPKLILDMKKVPMLNSVALGTFINIYKRVEELNGRIVFANLTPEVERLMDITRLVSVFEIFRNVIEAQESFNF